MNKKTDDGSALASLVRGELAAVETYKQALEKLPDGPASGELQRIEAEHEDAVRLLQERMARSSSKVQTHSGTWGEWAKVVEGAAKAFGKKAAIKALKEGEEHGIHGYVDALVSDKLDTETKRIIRSSLLPKTEAHIPVLDRLLQTA
ncbi:MAG: DUF2383 domain-containing protein [Elusimicrobia bacterium]|nr:DUF2383 domain-containing protein [Elusimicrobiota bacterium]